MGIIKHKETDKEIADRLLKLTDGKDYGILPPPMDAQVALDELQRYFLGDNWYTTLPLGRGQVNTEIVYAIETKLKKYKVGE